MTLIHYKNQPTSIDQLWNQWLNEFPTLSVANTSAFPATNITEHKEGYQVALNVPGRRKEDFKIECVQGLLTIKTEDEITSNEGEGTLLRREFEIHPFTRSFHIDETIDTNGIEAKYEQGILKLYLPKKATVAPLTQHISVK